MHVEKITSIVVHPSSIYKCHGRSQTGTDCPTGITSICKRFREANIRPTENIQNPEFIEYPFEQLE